LVVRLVGDQDHRLVAAPQHLDRGLVDVRRADRHVDDDHDHVGGLHGDFRLGGDGGGAVAGVGLPAAGVDDGEAAAVPLGVVGDAVAGHAGHVLDDRLAAADDAVDQGGFAYVGAADDGDHRNRAGRDIIGDVKVGGNVTH
jgi:hypothetical protein